MLLTHSKVYAGVALALSLFLTACSGDDGATGPAGPAGTQGPTGQDGADGQDGDDGQNGSNGLNSLTTQTRLFGGNPYCHFGGTRIDSGLDQNANGTLSRDEITDTSYVCVSGAPVAEKSFNRIATFNVCTQVNANCDFGGADDPETSAEIVAATDDGLTLIYTDSPLNQIGFVNLNDPANPSADGVLAMPGEPTSVAVKGDYALVGTNQSTDFINVAGTLEVIDINTKSIVRSIDLGGQPDSVAISPDGNYIAIAIENERDEDLGDGGLPQAPAGFLVLVNATDADPANWTSSDVALTGLADVEGSDPEPEYVDINSDNIAVVTLQENNYLVLVDVTDGTIVNHFTAGSATLNQVDATEDADIVLQTETITEEREPDGVSWISTEYFVTANEGDWNGGSRGFSVFNTDGDVVYDSANTMDHMTARVGHYPEGRSGNKGNEPENAEYGMYGDEKLLFVNSERSSLVFVYNVNNPVSPEFKQILPTAAGPEGALAIPARNLLVVASEEGAVDDKLFGAVNIYRYETEMASYPTMMSADRADGTPIPFAALSGLSADLENNGMIYSVEDSAFDSSRIFAIDTSVVPAKLIQEIRIVDTNDVFAAISTDDVSADEEAFSSADLAAMINADKTINIDPEGIAKASDGGFWVASEGNGTIGDANRPIRTLNFIFKTDANGVIENVITLPAEVNAIQLRFGFEGVAEYDGSAYVAFQRVWGDDSAVRIGKYDLATSSWSFFFYPLDAVESIDGGWVGLSDLTSVGDGTFLVLERDNKMGPYAAIKRIYHIDTNGLSDGDTVTKTLVKDIYQDLTREHQTFEKVEGMALLPNGDVLIVNDNDGVDDNSGESQLINLGPILN